LIDIERKIIVTKVKLAIEEAREPFLLALEE